MNTIVGTANLNSNYFALVSPLHTRRRVTVVESVCVCVHHISPLECLFVPKILSRIQRATEVKSFVGFSLKSLRCRDPALPPHTVGHFPAKSAHAYCGIYMYHIVSGLHGGYVVDHK